MAWRDRIGALVRQARLDRGLKQEALAEMIGVAPLSVSHIENGRQAPKVDTLERISEATGKPLFWFFQQESEMQSQAQSVEPETCPPAEALVAPGIDEATSAALAHVVGLAVGQAMSESQALLVKVLERIEHLERLRQEEHAEVHRLRHEIRAQGRTADAKYYRNRSDQAPSADARAEGA